jgi:adenosylmethionine-8-amino-7-oxononanoate aminotransferase
MNYWQKKDLQYIWHPCSQMKDYEELPPLVIAKGEGVYLYDLDGKRYLDAISSWWVNLFGHCNPRINAALQRQVAQLEQVIFANFSHQPAIELAERIVALTPEGLEKVFFADNGSSAVEVGLKLSFQYHQQAGNAMKTKYVALTDAYHGETLGALAVGDLDLYNRIFKPLLLNTYKASGPDCFRCGYQQNRQSCNAECFVTMEQLVVERHQGICAVIIEPLLQAAAGMKMYPPVYLKKLRELCSRYEIHLIADEIAAGFGRTGTMFACEQAGISPDLLCLSKGLTAGYLPLSLVVTTNEIYEAFYHDYTELKAFMHSHSYTGNPLACAVACESLNIFQDENVLENNRAKAKYLGELAEAMAARHPHVGEFRQLGMVGAFELVEEKASKKPFDWKKRVGYQIYQIALKQGLLLRPLGNVIYFMPPYVINEAEIESMVNGAFGAIDRFFDVR